VAGLLLVEDEEAIKQKLLNNVSWGKYGFDPVVSAGNGLEALAMLERYPIEIMVTDVQMPKMNGIELIKEIKRRNYRMKIIVISGFAEFEYAQESIKLNVSDYLLKPFASRRLLEVVLRYKDELEREQADRSELNNLREQLQKNMAALQEKLILDLLNGNRPAGNIGAQLEFLGLATLENHRFQVAVLEIPEHQLSVLTEEEKYLLNMQFFEQVRRLFDEEDAIAGWHWIVNCRRNRVAMIVLDPDPDLPSRLEEKLEQLRTVLNRSLACGVGHPYHELADLSVSYKEACSALQYRYLYGMNQVFSINDLNLDNPSYHKLFYYLHQNSIFDNLKIGADAAIQKDLKSFIHEMRQARLSPELSKIVVSNLLLLTSATLNELGYNAIEVFGSGMSSLTMVSQAESLEELEGILESLFKHIQEFINRKRTSYNHQLVEEIRQYLDDHFETDITLSAMATRYKISPSYLSLLFSERTGKNFSDYLTERRIKKAKELLKHSDLKIYEISNAVGYNDSFYFSNCFKKLMGVSPTEYRENTRTLK
jgi:two-component system response regulator YesN